VSKLCINCKYFTYDHRCWHPNNANVSLVDGVVRAKLSPEYLREKHSGDFVKCEPEALWFESAEVSDIRRPDEWRPDHDLDRCGRTLKAGT